MALGTGIKLADGEVVSFHALHRDEAPSGAVGKINLEIATMLNSATLARLDMLAPMEVGSELLSNPIELVNTILCSIGTYLENNDLQITRGGISRIRINKVPSRDQNRLIVVKKKNAPKFDPEVLVEIELNGEEYYIGMYYRDPVDVLEKMDTSNVSVVEKVLRLNVPVSFEHNSLVLSFSPNDLIEGMDVTLFATVLIHSYFNTLLFYTNPDFLNVQFKITELDFSGLQNPNFKLKKAATAQLSIGRVLNSREFVKKVTKYDSASDVNFLDVKCELRGLGLVKARIVMTAT